MNVFELYDTDKSTVEDGIWCDFGDFKILLAHCGVTNKNYQKTRAFLEKKYRAKSAKKDLSEHELTDLLAECFAECIVLDWKGMSGKSGKSLKYSKDAAKELLKKLPNFLLELVDISSDFTRFQKDQEKQEKKS